MKKISYLLILAGASLWGTIGIFVRQLNEYGFSSAQITALRAYVTASLLLLFLLITDRKKLKIRLRDCWMFIGTGRHPRKFCVNEIS